MTILLNTTDVHHIAKAIDEASVNVISAYSQLTHENQLSFSIGPERIASALGQFLDIMYMIEMDKSNKDIADDLGYEDSANALDRQYDQPLNSLELTEIGNYGLDLMQTLSDWAGRLQLNEEQQQLQSAMIVVSLWIARQGGSLTTIDTIVDTIGEVAQSYIEPNMLRILCDVIRELIYAVSNEVKSLDAPGHLRDIWRNLNANWGIIATRTKDIDLMQQVFDQLANNIPQDVANFFEQAMMQISEHDFPLTVQQVIKSYYQRYTVSVLH